MSTRGSAAILGRDDIGQIAPGKAADFFLIDLNRLSLTGAQLDVSSMLATVGFRESVDYTVADGQIVVRKGRLTAIDEEKTASEASRVLMRYMGGQ